MRLEPGEIIQISDWNLKPEYYYVVVNSYNFNLNNKRMITVHNLKWGCLEKIALQPWEDKRRIEPVLLASATPWVRLFGYDHSGYPPFQRQFVAQVSILDLRKNA